MPTTQTSFTTPGYDYGVELGQIERRRKLAEAMQQQSMQDIPQQTAGGWVVPTSPLAAVSKLAQAFSAKRSEAKADLKQKELNNTIQGDYRAMLAKGLGQLQGTPAQTIQPDPQEAQQAADQGTPQVGVVNKPAQAPDPAAALATFGSHPMGQQMVPLAMQQVQNQQRQQMLATALRGGSGGGSPQPGSGTPGTGGFGAGIPPQIMALMSSGDAELVGIGKSLLEANKGVAQRPGAPVVNPFTGAVIAQPTPAVPAGVGLQVGPGGPQAYPVPGAQGAMANLTSSQAGATEAGKAPYQLSTYNTPGSPTVMTHQQAIEAATGQPMPQPGQQQAPQQAAPQGPTPNVPPEDANAFRYVQDQARQGLPARALGNSQYSGPKQPGMRLQDQGESRAQVEMGEGLGRRYNAIQDAGFSANQKMQKFERLGNLLSSIETGKLTPAGTELSAWAKAAGVPIGEGVDNAQAAKALSNEMALELRNPSGGAGMPGAMSDSDRNYLQSLIASIDKTPGANKFLVEGMTKLAQRDREVSQLARDYKKKNGSFDDGFYDELAKFSDANPLFKGQSRGRQMFAVNPQTKARIVSTDGGQTWKPAQ